MILNKYETALVFAGLRLLQQEMNDAPHCLPPSIQVILDDADIGEGGIDAIDRLCEDKIDVVESERELPVIIITGNPVDGFSFFGPYANSGEAGDKAEGVRDTDYWVEQLQELT